MASPLVTRGESKWAFMTHLGIIFSFHSWQATRERKKPVPSPQPKGIKTFLLKSPLCTSLIIIMLKPFGIQEASNAVISEKNLLTQRTTLLAATARDEV